MTTETMHLALEFGDEVTLKLTRNEEGRVCLTVGDDDTSFVVPLEPEHARKLRDWLNRAVEG